MKLVIPIAFAFAATSFATDAAYAPLMLYNGAWQVTQKDRPPDTLVDECARIGKYYACQQTVNGKLGALVVFIPAETPGHYFTQAVLPQGWATGRGELQIEGDHWTYLSKSQEDGKTTWYRTTNVFTGKDQIHFEQAESPDNEHWTTKSSGDEVRLRRGKIAH
jgi:hypothetical protein